MVTTERIISTVTAMGRTLSLLARLPRFEDDGVMHRRDCECVRCDAGYRPTEHERAAARRRQVEHKAREQAAREATRRKERERMKLAVVDVFVDEQVQAASHRGAGAARRAKILRAAADERLAQLREPRRTGFSLRDAIRRGPAPRGGRRARRSGSRVRGSRWAQQGSNPAANGLKVCSSAS